VIRRRIHRQQRRHLHQMVLHNVSDCPDFLVESAAATHAEIFRQSDLHALDEGSIPDRLQEGVGESEVK
jgi:hypothetical protein